MRLFLAINLPVDVRREVAIATEPLREILPQASWVSELRLHLTLKFFGERPEEEVQALRGAMAAAAGRHRELMLDLGGVGAFPNFRKARVVWFGVEQSPRLELLHHDVELAYGELGFEVEGRPFRPHLTLARVKERLDEQQAKELSRAAKRVEYRTNVVIRSVDLMCSELGPAGSSYTMLASAPLRSG